MFQKKTAIDWVEWNVQIVESEFSSTSWGTEVAHAQNKAVRRVKLTVEIPLNEGQSVRATRKFWTLTKNRNFFQVGNYITVLYNKSDPKQFKLKYDS